MSDAPAYGLILTLFVKLVCQAGLVCDDVQGTAAIEYSWLPRDATPHNWTTEIISDLSMPITFVGLCTIDRRNIYPPKEAGHCQYCTVLPPLHFSGLDHMIFMVALTIGEIK